MSPGIEDISDENYEAFIFGPAAIVAYGIAGCDPCLAYDPVLEEIAGLFTHVRVGKAKMHVPGRCREIKKRHQFETYPTTHLFSRGTLILAREGKLEVEELSHLIERHFLPGQE